MKVYPIAVVGGGSAGTMAILRGVLNNDDCLFFPGGPKNKKKSRAQWVAKVENMPAHFEYKKGIGQPGLETIKWIGESIHKDKLHLQKNRGVDTIEKTDEGIFRLVDSKGDEWFAEYVVLCTGIMDVQPIINGEMKPIFPYANAQVADYCLRCDGHHVIGKDTTIIGHGNGAAWVSIMLHERYQTPSMIILTHGKKPEFSEETLKLIEKYNIKVIESEIDEVLGNPKEADLHGFKLKDGTEVKSNFTFVSLGMIVYNELAKSLGADIDDRGFVTTGSKGMSSIENLYVAGDLRAGFKKQIYTAWDMAVDSLDEINGKIRKAKREA